MLFALIHLPCLVFTCTMSCYTCMVACTIDAVDYVNSVVGWSQCLVQNPTFKIHMCFVLYCWVYMYVHRLVTACNKASSMFVIV